MAGDFWNRNSGSNSEAAIGEILLGRNRVVMIVRSGGPQIFSLTVEPRKLVSFSRTAAPEWQLWLLAAGLPLCLCAGRLNCDLWYDEAYTVIHFVSQPWHRIICDYSAPNNHIFYSLLLHPVYLLSAEEFVLRLPGFLFAAGTLWFTFRAGTACGGILPGVLATLWLGLTQMFIIHVMELRGYGLSLFLTAILGYLAFSNPKRSSPRGFVASIGGPLCICALVYTIPTNLLFAISLTAFRAVREWDSKARAFGLRESWYWLGGILAGCALYLPVWEQLHATATQAAGWNWQATLMITIAFFRAAFHDWWPALMLGILLYGVDLGCKWLKPKRGSHGRRHGEQRGQPIFFPYLWGWLAAGIIAPFILAGLLGVHPFVRNFLPALYFLAVGCGVLLATLFQLLTLGILAGWPSQKAVEPPIQASPAIAFPASSQTDSSSRVTNLGMAGRPIIGQILAAHLISALVVFPQLWSYPNRLEKKRQTDPVQDGYYNYYAARYHPSEAVRFIRDFVEAMAPARSYRVLFRQADFYPLAYYLAQEGVAPELLNASYPEEHVFLVLPPHVSVKDFLREYRGDPRMAENFRFLKDAGYYRIFWAVGEPSRDSEPVNQPALRRQATFGGSSLFQPTG